VASNTRRKRVTRALSAKQKQVFDKTLTLLCGATLNQIKPGISSTKRKLLLAAYKLQVTVLAAGGWLTRAQATELVGLANQL